jgi:hypothetical protein
MTAMPGMKVTKLEIPTVSMDAIMVNSLHHQYSEGLARPLPSTNLEKQTEIARPKPTDGAGPAPKPTGA